MKIRLFGREVLEITRQGKTKNRADDWAAALSGGDDAVGSTAALKISAVFRCVDLLSKTMATLPLHLYRVEDGKKEYATEHRLYQMLLRLPNPYTTAYEFWQMFTTNLLLTKGAYARIKRNSHGQITSLWNIPTCNVVYTGTNARTGEPYITVTDGQGNAENLYPWDYMHVPGMLYQDPTDPEDPLEMAADVLGLTKNLSGYAAATFRQGINPGGFIEIPTGLSEDAYNRLQRDFEQKYAGVRNSGKFILLEEGAKAQLFTRDLEKSQVLESRKFAVAEICRIFGVPPHMCMDMDRATFSNIEQQSREYVRDAINPLSVRMEEAVYRDMLTPMERKKYFAKFNTKALLRGDTAAQTQFYNSMRQNGIMTADEIRDSEDMNPLPDGLGKIAYINGNMLPLQNAINNTPRGGAAGAQNKTREVSGK